VREAIQDIEDSLQRGVLHAVFLARQLDRRRQLVERVWHAATLSPILASPSSLSTTL
jgi:hypothetical protein